ncbi:MAG: L,D-transpeptidase [Pseudomonadota bacterium]
MLKLTGAARAALTLAAGTFAIAALPSDANAAKRNSLGDRYVVAFPKSHAAGQIIVSFTDRRLYHVTAPGRAVSYPIAVPRPKSRWSGTNRITRKAVNPTWTPTASMRRENPKLPRVVKGGDPRNPLGNRALYLGSTLYRIHGTDAPWTIGKNLSKGCVRMHNSHVADLYKKVRVGTRVTATYKSYRAVAKAPLAYIAAAPQAKRVTRNKRRVVRRVGRNGYTVRTYRAQQQQEPKLLDWLLGS